MEYYVIQFAKSPTNKCNLRKYAYIPSTWVLTLVDNQILFRYPREKKSVTKNRIDDGETVSEAWPMHFKTVLYKTGTMESARDHGACKVTETSESLNDASNCVKIMKASCRETFVTHFPTISGQSKSHEQQHQDSSNDKSKKRRAVEDDSTDEDVDKSTSTSDTMNLNQAQMICDSIKDLVKEIKQQNDCLEKLMRELGEIRNVSLNNAATLKKMQSEILMNENDGLHCNTEGKHDEQVQKNTAKTIKKPRKADKVERKQKDSKWTLRYPKMAPGLEELQEGTCVYVDSERFANCKKIAADGLALARLLLVEVFTDEALATCSLTGARPAGWSWSDQKPIKPGLDEHARHVLLDFVDDYCCERNWPGSNQLEEKEAQTEDKVTPRKGSRWTLRYQEMAPGLEELVEDTDIYIDSQRLANCMDMAHDGSSLATLLLVEIFSDEALATCAVNEASSNERWSLGPFKEFKDPNLNKYAVMVLIDFVIDYAWEKKWVCRRRRLIEIELAEKLDSMQNKKKLWQ